MIGGVVVKTQPKDNKRLKDFYRVRLALGFFEPSRNFFNGAPLYVRLYNNDTQRSIHRATKLR